MVGKNEILKYDLCILMFIVILDEICFKFCVCMKKIYVIIFMFFVYKNCIKKNYGGRVW